MRVHVQLSTPKWPVRLDSEKNTTPNGAPCYVRFARTTTTCETTKHVLKDFEKALQNLIKEHLDTCISVF